jgi:hypothetical protein
VIRAAGPRLPIRRMQVNDGSAPAICSLPRLGKHSTGERRVGEARRGCDRHEPGPFLNGESAFAISIGESWTASDSGRDESEHYAQIVRLWRNELAGEGALVQLPRRRTPLRAAIILSGST